MPTIYTHPDFNTDRSILKVLIRNCDWTDIEIQQIVNQLSDKTYEIYLYHDSVNDIQWAEGIRANCKKVLDWHHYKGKKEPIELLKELDNEF